MAIFFITGTSGSGKSTLKQFLQLDLCKEKYVVYDFDERGVPENADVIWRQKTTDYWLDEALKNSLQNKSTIICGVSVPSEIMQSQHKAVLPIYFGFLKIDDDIIRARLQQRNWHDQLIQNNINWAHYLEAEVKRYKDHLIVDCSTMVLKEVQQQVVAWIARHTLI